MSGFQGKSTVHDLCQVWTVVVVLTLGQGVLALRSVTEKGLVVYLFSVDYVNGLGYQRFFTKMHSRWFFTKLYSIFIGDSYSDTSVIQCVRLEETKKRLSVLSRFHPSSSDILFLKKKDSDALRQGFPHLTDPAAQKWTDVRSDERLTSVVRRQPHPT